MRRTVIILTVVALATFLALGFTPPPYYTSGDALNKLVEFKTDADWTQTTPVVAHDLTVADTTLLTTGWSMSDCGYIAIAAWFDGVANTGSGPSIYFYSVIDGRWYGLYEAANAGAASTSHIIPDGDHAEQITVFWQMHTTQHNPTAQLVFGDSILAVLVPNDASAGTATLHVWLKKE